MASAKLYEVDYQVVKVRTGGGAGAVHSYRNPTQKALVYAATPSAVQAVLNSNISLQSGETVEITQIKDATAGSAGVIYS